MRKLSTLTEVVIKNRSGYRQPSSDVKEAAGGGYRITPRDLIEIAQAEFDDNISRGDFGKKVRALSNPDLHPKKAVAG